MPKKLSREDLYSFLSIGHCTAQNASVKSDGSLVVSPVWFVMDSDDLVFTTMNTSLKYRLIRKDPRISVCVEDESYPYGFATIQGKASAHTFAE